MKAIANEITEAAVLDATDELALRQVDITAFQTVELIINPDRSVRFLANDILVLIGEKRPLTEFGNLR